MRETLKIQGIPVTEIAERFQTPMFLYDGDILKRQFNKVRTAFHPSLEIFYSLKANPNISIYGLLNSLGARAEVSSMAELATAVNAGTPPENIICVGPGKTEHELETLIRTGIYAIICESFAEMERIHELAGRLGKTQDIALRINPAFAVKGSRLTMGGKPRQFGIDETVALEQAVAMQAKYPKARIKGIQIYSGTRILAWEEVLANTVRILETAEQYLTKTGLPLEMVDVGGGLGVPYFDDEHDLDIEKLGQEMTPALAAFNAKHPNTRLIMELGRYLSAESGMLLSRVQYVKDSMGETFAVSDGGTNCHMAAVGVGSFVKRNFPIKNACDWNGVAEKAYHVTGPLCTPNDVVGKAVKLAKVEPGDLVAVLVSGAYGPTASPVNFLSFGFPAEVLVLDGEAYLIRERDFPIDMLRKQHLLSFSEGQKHSPVPPPYLVPETEKQWRSTYQ